MHVCMCICVSIYIYIHMYMYMYTNSLTCILQHMLIRMVDVTSLGFRV